MIGKELLERLENCKYNEEEIVFIAQDKEDNVIWLERGNENAGLVHIILNHKSDFENAYGINENEIALYLYKVVSEGNIVCSTPSIVKGGIDIIYEYDSKYYTFIGKGSNGFIVTAFPTHK